jgi:hypothetical protein
MSPEYEVERKKREVTPKEILENAFVKTFILFESGVHTLQNKKFKNIEIRNKSPEPLTLFQFRILKSYLKLFPHRGIKYAVRSHPLR